MAAAHLLPPLDAATMAASHLLPPLDASTMAAAFGKDLHDYPQYEFSAVPVGSRGGWPGR